MIIDKSEYFLFLQQLDKAHAIGLHEEGVAIGSTVLELGWHNSLEIVDAIKAFLAQVPDVEDAGVFFCA